MDVLARCVRLPLIAAALASVSLASFDAAADCLKTSPSCESYQTWTSLTIQKNLGSKFVLYGDANFRFYPDFNPYQVLIRPALGYRLDPKQFILWAGYGWTPSWGPGAPPADPTTVNPKKGMVDEHRLWQQFTYDSLPLTPLGVKLFWRSRIEERLRPGEGGQVGFRFRQMARALVPFYPGSMLHVSVWDEVFLGLNETAGNDTKVWQVQGFDQNRFFAGLGVKPTDVLRVEVGYLNHHVQRRQGAPNDIHNALMVNAFLTLP